MLKKHFIWLFVAAIVVLPLSVFAVVYWYQSNYQALPVLGEEGHTVADFKMINQDGKIITVTDWKDKITVVDFFFTHCTSICPRMTRNLKTVQHAYGSDDQILLNSFSVDPERDSVERLHVYALQFGINKNWNLLTGNKKEIYRLARKSFLVVATDGDGGPADFIHSDNMVLIDKQKRIRGFYNGTDETETAQLIKDIKKLKTER